MKVNRKDLDRIEKFYLAEASLSPKELEQCARYEQVFAIYCHVKNKKQTISKYMAILKSKGIEISISTAYRDLDAAENLFAPIRQYNKDFLRMVLIESAVKDLKRLEKELAKTKDSDKMMQLLMVKDRVEKRISDVSGLQKEDPNLPDFSQLQPHQFHIDLPVQMRSMMNKLLQQGVMDLTNMDLEDVDFEDLHDEVDSDSEMEVDQEDSDEH